MSSVGAPTARAALLVWLRVLACGKLQYAPQELLSVVQQNPEQLQAAQV
jgi:hypothetical protein